MDSCVFCNKHHDINLNSECKNYKNSNIVDKIIKEYVNINKTNLLDELKIYKLQKQFKCDKCNIIFKSKQNLNYHLTHAVCSKIKDKTQDFECELCGKTFAEKRNLQYHIERSVCNKEANNNINNTINNMSNTSNVSNTSNISNVSNISNNNSNVANQQNIQTQNNNTNNNIQINVNANESRKPPIEMIPFRNVSYKISTKKYLEYANNPEQAIRKFVKDEHLNPDKPERMNVLNTNPRSNRVQLFDFDEDFVCRWQTKDKNDISELLFDRGVNILFFAKIMLSAAGIKLDPKKETKLNAKIKEYESDTKLKKKYVDMISDLTYDYREIVGTNKKSIDQDIVAYKQLIE